MNAYQKEWDPWEDFEHGDKSKPIKLCEKWDWKRKALETERGDSEMLNRLSDRLCMNGYDSK